VTHEKNIDQDHVPVNAMKYLHFVDDPEMNRFVKTFNSHEYREQFRNKLKKPSLFYSDIRMRQPKSPTFSPQSFLDRSMLKQTAGDFNRNKTGFENDLFIDEDKSMGERICSVGYATTSFFSQNVGEQAATNFDVIDSDPIEGATTSLD
jgi:hypothetical protein